jgi:hypothetical protein
MQVAFRSVLIIGLQTVEYCDRPNCDLQDICAVFRMIQVGFAQADAPEVTEPRDRKSFHAPEAIEVAVLLVAVDFAPRSFMEPEASTIQLFCSHQLGFRIVWPFSDSLNDHSILFR